MTRTRPPKGTVVKRTVALLFAATLSAAGFASSASAAPVDAACFGQIHKAVNSGAVAGIDNVGQLVGAVGGGQAKNAVATGLCGG